MLRDAPNGPTPVHPPLTRAGIAATVARYRTESRGPERLRLIAIGFFGLIGGPTLVVLRALLALPAWLDIACLLAGWAILLWAVVAIWRREQQLRRTHTLPCPHCGAPLLAPTAWRSKTPPSTLAADLPASCPSCSAAAVRD